MREEELIQAMASLWHENGGDSEGIAWAWLDIKRAVEDLESNDA